ncbi:MAG: bifunctional nuclease family protein [Flavobacteriales bacterium]|nr:bifunctional nuclease family protein [Flavobacteriales bacterium]
MDLIQLNIKGISYSQTQTGSYALILEEESGVRKLPIIIGSYEAQSIALALESDLITKRPVTHDLFVTLGRMYHLNLKYVIIYKLEEGIFYSDMYFENTQGEEKVLDSRTSDAIALAIRFHAPIYTNKMVLDSAGVILEVGTPNDTKPKESIKDLETRLEEELSQLNMFSDYTLEELENKLNEAIRDEDYETAAHIRDEIDNRK